METKPSSNHKREISRQNLQLNYKKISLQLRKELISLVMKQGFTVYRASKILSINNSTAKAIIRKFRRNGTIFMRKSQMERQDSGLALEKSPENQQQLEGEQAAEEQGVQELNQAKEAQFYYSYSLGFQNFYILQNSCFMTYY